MRIEFEIPDAMAQVIAAIVRRREGVEVSWPWVARRELSRWAQAFVGQQATAEEIVQLVGLAESENLTIDEVDRRLRRLAWAVRICDGIRRQVVVGEISRQLRESKRPVNLARATVDLDPKPWEFEA